MPGRRIKHTNNPSLNQRRESFQINKNLNAPFRPRPGNLQQLRPEENYVQASDFNKEVSNKFFRQQQNIPATTISSDQLNRTIDANRESKAIKAQKIRANDEGFEFNQVQTPDTIFLRFRGPQSEIGIEQTFVVKLSSFPRVNFKTKIPVPTYPEFNFSSLTTTEELDEKFPIGLHYMISDINDESNNFTSDFFQRDRTNEGVPLLYLKKNRKYRFDLSHPSLSVVVNEPSEFISISNDIPNSFVKNNISTVKYEFLGTNSAKTKLNALLQNGTNTYLTGGESPESLLNDPILENKFQLFEDRVLDITDTTRGALTGLVNFSRQATNTVSRLFVPPEIRDAPQIRDDPNFDGEFINNVIEGVGNGTPTNKPWLDNSLHAFYTQENKLEFLTYNGEPGTPGAFMDLVIPNNCPETIFLFNSAHPQYYQVNNKNNFNENKLYRVDKSPIDSQYNLFKKSDFELSLRIKTYEDINLVDEVITDTSITDNLTVPGFLNLPISSNYTRNPLGVEEILLSTAEVNFHMSETYKKTRLNTLTALSEEVLPNIPVSPSMLSNKLSSLSFNYPRDLGFENYKFSFSDTGRKSKTAIPLFQDYLQPFTFTGSKSKPKATGWNENFWGYNNRDVFNFSGVTVDHSGFANSHQGILVTPKHVMLTQHWGSHPNVGDVLFFLEHTSGVRVSATIVDTYAAIKGNKKVSNTEFPKFPGGIGDIILAKLDTDLTKPNPDLLGSDGSVKVYKIMNWYNPPFFNRPNSEKIQLDDVDTFYVGRNIGLNGKAVNEEFLSRVQSITSDSTGTLDYKKVYSNDYSTFNFAPLSSFNILNETLSGYDNIISLPKVKMFGIGAFGRVNYNTGDNYVVMQPGNIQFNSNEFGWNVDNNGYRNVPLLSSNGFPLSTNSGSFLQTSRVGTKNTFTDFSVLTTSGNLNLKFYNNTNIPLRLGGLDAGVIVGDSSNPGFTLVKNYKGEGLELVIHDMTTGGCFSQSNEINRESQKLLGLQKFDPPESTDGRVTISNTIHTANYIIDNVFDGGNPEGFYLSAFDMA